MASFFNDNLVLIDFLVVLSAVIGVVLNIFATVIVLKYLFTKRTTRLFYKIYAIATVLALNFAVINFMWKKYRSSHRYCFLVDYISNVFLTYGLNASVMITLNAYMEMRFSRSSLFKTQLVYIAATGFGIVGSVLLNSPRLLYGIRNTLYPEELEKYHQLQHHSVYNQSGGLQRHVHRTIDCQIYVDCELIMFDVLDMIGKLIMPFFFKMVLIILIYKQLASPQPQFNKCFRVKTIKFCEYIIRISTLKLMVASSVIVVSFFKHFYGYMTFVELPDDETKSTSSINSQLLSDPRAIINRFVQIESILYIKYMLVYISPFVFYFYLNKKFRKLFYQFIKCRKPNERIQITIDQLEWAVCVTSNAEETTKPEISFLNFNDFVYMSKEHK